MVNLYSTAAISMTRRVLAACLQLQPVAVARTDAWGCRRSGRIDSVVDMPKSSNESVGSVVLVALECRLDVVGR